MIKFIDLFSGMGGIRLGFEQAAAELGIKTECVLASDIKQAAQKVFEQNHPDEVLSGDITQIKANDIPDFDILLAGNPCLTGDTLILTSDGYKQLIDIKPGDMVLSHDNQYHKVVRFMEQGVKAVVKIVGSGFDEIKATTNHKFYVRRKIYIKDKNSNQMKRAFLEPEWMTIAELMKLDEDGIPKYKNYYLCSATNQESKIPYWQGIDVHLNTYTITNKCSLDMSSVDFWYLVGRYIGDGWIKKNYKPGANRYPYSGVVICCEKKEKDQLIQKIPNQYKYTISEERTVYKFHFNNMELAAFLLQFGSGAKNKFLPGFVFDLPSNLLKAFLKGYFDSDGCYIEKTGTKQFTTTSKSLCYGITQCLLKVYQIPYEIHRCKMSQKTTIENRIVNQNDFYIGRLKIQSKRKCHRFCDNGYYWYPITKIEDINEHLPVYDIEVEGSHSFMANNCLTHNCQAFSFSGKRLGFEDTRGTLFFEVARILKEKQPYGFILENVEGLVVHDKQNKTDQIGQTLQTMIDVLEDLDYNVTWKVLNSRYFGVAQERKRIYIVGCKTEKISLDDFVKKEVLLKDILENGLPTVDTPFSQLLLKNYTVEQLIGKSINDKRGGTNNIHSWDIGYKGEIPDEEKKLMHLIMTERRKKKWAAEYGIDWMDGMPLTLKQIKSFYNNDTENLLNDLVKKGYLKMEHPKRKVGKLRVQDENLPLGYNIVAGKMSFEIGKILDPNNITPTLVATDMDRLYVVDGNSLRQLSLREGLRLFGYPDTYKFDVSKAEGYDLLGNTVVVPVIKAIAARLLTYLDK